MKTSLIVLCFLFFHGLLSGQTDVVNPSLGFAGENDTVKAIPSNDDKVEVEHNLLWWGSFGIGTGTFPESSLAVGFGLNLAHGNVLYGLRGIIAEEFRICIWGPCSPSEEAVEIGATYGRMKKGRYGHVSASAGLGVLFGREYTYDNERGEYKEDAFVTVGVPLEVQAFFTPFSFIGIGLTGFADITPRAVPVGFLVGVQFGKLRE